MRMSSRFGTGAMWITIGVLLSSGAAMAGGLDADQTAMARSISQRAALPAKQRAQSWQKTKALLIRLERSRPLRAALKARGASIVLGEHERSSDAGVSIRHQLSLTPRGLTVTEIAVGSSFGFNRTPRFVERQERPATVGSSLWPVKLELSRKKVRIDASAWGGVSAEHVSSAVTKWLKENAASQ